MMRAVLLAAAPEINVPLLISTLFLFVLTLFYFVRAIRRYRRDVTANRSATFERLTAPILAYLDGQTPPELSTLIGNAALLDTRLINLIGDYQEAIINGRATAGAPSPQAEAIRQRVAEIRPRYVRLWR